MKDSSLVLRDGWKICKLGEVCDVFNGSTPSKRKTNFWENGTINWFTIEDIRKQGRIINYTKQKVTKDGYESTSMRLLPPKAVLICCTASVGEYAISNIELSTNQQFNGLVIKDNSILLPEFLFYFSSTLKDKLLKLSGKTTIDFVSMTKLRNLLIPIPPLPEQKEIVATLDEAFAAIETAKTNIEKNIENANELFQSRLNDIFSRKRDGWEEKKLGEVCIVERGSSPRPINKYITDNEDGVNWIKIGDVNENDKYVRKTDQKITKEGAKKSRFVNVGDFILSNSMSFGRPYIMKIPGYIHDGWFVLRLPSELNPDYFWQLLASPYLKKQFEELAAGAIVKNISSVLVKKAIIPLPPFNVQDEIVKETENLHSILNNLQKNYQQKLSNLEDLKQSLLQKAFAGELT